MSDSVTVNQDVRVVMLPIGNIRQNDWNPNELSAAMFNRLTEDMRTLGFLQPILVVPLEDGKYRIVNGEHRFECARLLDMELVPCVIVEGEFASNETAQKVQTMRMNMIRGNVDKRKLKALVEDLTASAPIEDVAEALAFDDVDALKALIDDARKDLPPEVRREFDKKKSKIKTVQDLTEIVSRLLTKYGSTIPYDYMIMDFGGKQQLLVRFPDKKAYAKVVQAAKRCQEHDVSFSFFPALQQILLACHTGLGICWMRYSWRKHMNRAGSSTCISTCPCQGTVRAYASAISEG